MVPFGQIADMIGRPRMAKFVGYTYKNKNYQNLPWHRIVFKDGGLAPRIFNKQYKKLKSKGIKFDKNKKVKMSQYQWRPDKKGKQLDIYDFPLVF